MPTKHSRGGEAKESIVLLCRILKYSGVYKTLSPDDVRLAKFDKPEVIPQMSKVLIGIIEHGELQSVHNRSESLADSLKKLRYPRWSALFNKAGTIVSSREALLAVAWYIHIDKTVERVQNDALCAVDIKDLLHGKLVKSKNKRNPSHSERDSLSDKISRLTWIVSQLHLLKQEVVSISAGNIRRTFLLGSQLKSEFTDDPLLLLAVRNPALGTEYENCLERKILLLQSCIQWRKVENVFWLWMGSVLETAPTIDEAHVKEKILTVSPLLFAFTQKLKVLGQELKDQRQKCACDTEVIPSQLRPEQNLEVNREIADLHTRLMSGHHNPSLRAVVDQTKRGTLKTSVPLQAEIERLADVNSDIMNELAELRLLAREKLQAISMKFPESVLIPPEVPHHKS